MAKKIQPGNPGSGIPKSEADDLVGPAIPPPPVPIVPVKPDVSDPWYRPAKQYIRRVQWNGSILQLLNKLPEPAEGEERVLRYVGLPGQHHMDLRSMRGICTSKGMRIQYLGYRIGPGAPNTVTPLDQLAALSDSRFHTASSYVVPDSVENIGSRNTPAFNYFRDSGPFDVINLDVCGGVLHGQATSLLNAIRAILHLQNPRQEPWLLFVTTLAQPDAIAEEVLNKFFKALSENCEQVANFRDRLNEACERCGLNAEESLVQPDGLEPQGFIRFFTLAFGKWLLANLNANSPRSVARLQSVFGFRNTDRREPEMLSLAYLVTPVIAGGPDPTSLTGRGAAAAPRDRYEDHAVNLISPSLDGMQDLDEVWQADENLMNEVLSDCETLLRQIGVDDAGLSEWRAHHGLN